MREVYVDHLAYALGDVVQTVQQAADHGRILTTVETLHKAGFTQHHVCGPETHAYELARRAVHEQFGVLLRNEVVLLGEF